MWGRIGGGAVYDQTGFLYVCVCYYDKEKNPLCHSRAHHSPPPPLICFRYLYPVVLDSSPHFLSTFSPFSEDLIPEFEKKLPKCLEDNNFLQSLDFEHVRNWYCNLEQDIFNLRFVGKICTVF